MNSSQRLFLIDSMSIAYRAYYAFSQRPLINSKGENTSAIYGFTTFLLKILSDEKPDYIAAVFDTPEPTFRHKRYEPYKATRAKMPEDMSAQIPLLKDLIQGYGVPVLELEGYEADDIIGTFARRAEKEGIDTFLVTSDKDFLQLVSKKIKIYKQGRRTDEAEIVGFEGVKEKFGVTPDKVIDVLSLMGDSSDNIPGVPGIGEKTAIPLIQKYGSLEGVLLHIEEIPQKGVREKIQTNRELALLSRELVTIDTNVPLELDFHQLRTQPKNSEVLVPLLERLEFRSLARRIKEKRDVPPSPPQKTQDETIEFVPPPPLTNISNEPHQYHLVSSLTEVQELTRKLEQSESFVLDTETTSTDALNCELVGIAFSLKSREAYYIPLQTSEVNFTGDLFSNANTSANNQKGLNTKEVLKLLQLPLKNPHIKKIGQNIKYDILVLSQYEIEVEGEVFDTMVASYILRGEGQHNLDALASEHLNYKTITFDELVGTGSSRKDIRAVPVEKISDYSCEDADITFQLWGVLKKRLEDEQMFSLCEDIEFPLIGALSRMEIAGVSIDVEFLKSLSKELELTLDNLVREVQQLAREQFNVNSTQQLAEILFNKLKLPPVRKTKTGYSTDVGVLEELRNEHPIIEKLLDYRQFAKLRSTYIDALPKLINPKTKRVHTSFNQTVATTGRLSSSDPNLQNIPIRSELGRSIRKAFVPPKLGDIILSADYSQIELRVMAHISGDEVLRSAFLNKEDIHLSTAAKVFNLPFAEVTREIRRKAKEINFGIMYGIGAYGLSSRLGISQNEGKEIIDRYFERFPKVKQYINDTIADARSRGYVSTLLGRRRYITDINSRNRNIAQAAERQAINMPIQGTAADMIKKAMIDIDMEMQRQSLNSKMILQVHDELVFEVSKNELDEMKILISDKMVNALPLSVPIEIEIGVGPNWFEAH